MRRVNAIAFEDKLLRTVIEPELDLSFVSPFHSLKPSAEATVLMSLKEIHRYSPVAQHQNSASHSQRVARWSGHAKGKRPEAY
jgi:hypothetical protein